MGKNKSQNSPFYHFMLEYKKQQGNHSLSMEQVQVAAGSIWQNMGPDARKPYMVRANKCKQSTAKYNSAGVKIEDIERREQMEAAKQSRMRQYINETVRNAVASDRLEELDIFIIHFNYFCILSPSNDYVPAEVGLSKFNLRNGVLPENVLHQIIKPGYIPLGYNSEMRKRSKESHEFEVPDPEDVENLAEVLQNIIKFMKKNNSNLEDSQFPPFYTMPKQVPIAENILKNLCRRFGYDEELFTVYPLDQLFFEISNAIGSQHSHPSVNASLLILEKDVYDFCRDIACEFHQQTEKINYCSRSYAIRLAYMICDHCCADIGIDLLRGQHVPMDARIYSSRPASTVSRTESIAGSEFGGFEATTSRTGFGQVNRATYTSILCKNSPATNDLSTSNPPSDQPKIPNSQERVSRRPTTLSAYLVSDATSKEDNIQPGVSNREPDPQPSTSFSVAEAIAGVQNISVGSQLNKRGTLMAGRGRGTRPHQQ